MINRRGIIALAVCLIVTSCGPSQALGPTTTPIPTNTQAPTSTITPTPLGNSSGNILHTISLIENENIEDIYITNLATFEKTQVTHSSNENISYSAPMASHDGEKIVYVRKSDNGATYYGEPIWTSEIFIMDIDGENQEKISNIQLFVGNLRIRDYLFEYRPAWSPDDKKIAFESNRSTLIENAELNESEIFVINLDTYVVQQLTKARDYSEHPSWSPDGEYITFMSNRDGDWDIYYMKSDGSGKDIKITNNTATDRFPSWSHDGKKIIYHSDRDGNLNLYIYNFDTEEEIRLTNHPSDEYTARWSPDDSWIVFATDRDGDDEIYIMNISTKEEIRITDNEDYDGFQSWVP